MSPRQMLSALLVVILVLLTPMNGASYAATAAQGMDSDEATGSPDMPLDIGIFPLGVADKRITWAEAAKRLSQISGYLEEDALALDLSLYQAQIPGACFEDDSRYLALLARNGYLSGPVNPWAEMSMDELTELIESVFPRIVVSQADADADADALLVTDEIENLFVSGDQTSLSTFNAARIALAKAEQMTLTGIRANTLTNLDTDHVRLEGVTADRMVVDRVTADSDTHLLVDSDTKVQQIILLSGDRVTIEGSGFVDTIRIRNSDLALTVRASAAVANETDHDITFIDPQGKPRGIAPGEVVKVSLEEHTVTFVTDGTPVEPMQVPPDGAVDFTDIATEKENAQFTAWYQDPEYTKPFSTMTIVERSLTLYARFIDDLEALVVHFETFDGLALDPQVFAAGENLLCKPMPSVYTTLEGYTFGGWFRDETLTESFGYTDPIDQSMTLYAHFINNEIAVEEGQYAISDLRDIDWQSEIAIEAPQWMSMEDVAARITIELGVGAVAPEVSLRETEHGFSAYGAYYTQGDETGFEPGARFTISASDGIAFYDAEGRAVDAVAVSVFKEEREILAFKEDISYVLWQHVEAFEAIPASASDGADGEGTYGEETREAAECGTLTLRDVDAPSEGDIVIFYDGEINDDEINISEWTGGDFAGYVLFAKVMRCQMEDDLATIEFGYADPSEFIDEMDLHVTRDIAMDKILDKEQRARIEDGIAAQVAANEELRAQMLASVMTAPDTQRQLDELYGEGVYQLALVVPTLSKPSVQVDFSVNGSAANATVHVQMGVNLYRDGNNLLLSTMATLLIEQSIRLDVGIGGGFLWIDAYAEYRTKTKLNMTVTANTDTSMGKIGQMLEELSLPEGIFDVYGEASENGDYLADLSNTMKQIVDHKGLAYHSLFTQRVFELRFTYKGIVSLILGVDLEAQTGIMASFGVTAEVEKGERVGIKYDFLSFSGSTYTHKLNSGASMNLTLVGKLGVRVGLKLSVTIRLCGLVDCGISGAVYVYFELSGISHLGLNGQAASLNACGWEIGVIANLSLNLSVNVILVTVKKSWSVWNERWKLAEGGASTPIRLMNADRLGKMLAPIGNYDALIISSIPIRTYDMRRGTSVDADVPWAQLQSGHETVTMSVEIQKLTGMKTGELQVSEIALTDETKGFVSLQYDGENAAPEISIHPEVIDGYNTVEAEYDIVIVYQNTYAGHLIKKHTFRFPSYAFRYISESKIILQFMLKDWCAENWGIEKAEWHNQIIDVQIFQSRQRNSPQGDNAVAEVDLAAIVNKAVSENEALAEYTLSWRQRGADGYADPEDEKYGIAECLFTGDSGSGDPTAVTLSYPFTGYICRSNWNLYVYRYPR